MTVAEARPVVAPGRDGNAPDVDAVLAAGTFTTRARSVTEADVAAFCALTGDWHPQHSDIEWARSSMFGERIAHGMLVISVAIGLAPIDYDRVVALRRCEATFSRPVRLGDTIHVEGRAVAAKPIDEALALVTSQWRIVNQDGKVVARAQLQVVWRLGDTETEAA